MKSLTDRLDRLIQKIENEEHGSVLLDCDDLGNEIANYNQDENKHLTIEEVRRKWKFDAQMNSYLSPGFRIEDFIEEENNEEL